MSFAFIGNGFAGTQLRTARPLACQRRAPLPAPGRRLPARCALPPASGAGDDLPSAIPVGPPSRMGKKGKKKKNARKPSRAAGMEGKKADAPEPRLVPKGEAGPGVAEKADPVAPGARSKPIVSKDSSVAAKKPSTRAAATEVKDPPAPAKGTDSSADVKEVTASSDSPDMESSKTAVLASKSETEELPISSTSAAPPSFPDTSFSSMAAGPPAAKPVGGRLGRKKEAPPSSPKFAGKTAADFAAEGIVDDTDDEEDLFEAEDIRFGVGDVSDPFSEDDARSAAVEIEETAAADRSAVGEAIDVAGDGAVLKSLVRPGSGPILESGSTVTVSYTGKLESGKVFDSTDGKDGFEFELGAGKVIKGWEAGVSTMKLGEIADFTISPSYAYGRRGMPPVIPGNATLTFTVEVTGATAGETPIKSVQEYNPDTAREPEDIAREYDERLQTQAERKSKMSWLERFYIISPFASQTGEALPWWINPKLTFVGIFGLVGVAFYLVFISGAIHLGYVQDAVDVNIFK